MGGDALEHRRELGGVRVLGGWHNVGPVGAPIVIAEVWELNSVDLKAITAVENKANLKFRIRFTGTGSDGASGNKRSDNLTVEGIPLA